MYLHLDLMQLLPCPLSSGCCGPIGLCHAVSCLISAAGPVLPSKGGAADVCLCLALF